MRKLDITDKLKFEEKPVLTFKGESFELDDSALAVLEVMELVGNDPTMVDMIKAAERVFGNKYERMLKLCGTFSNLTKVIEAAIDLVTDDEAGEQATPSMISSPTGILL